MVLKRVVLYFYKHPREHVQPQDVNLSEEVAEAAEKNPVNSDPNSTEQKVFSEQAAGSSAELIKEALLGGFSFRSDRNLHDRSLTPLNNWVTIFGRVS